MGEQLIMKKLFESWRYYLTEDQLLRERIKKYIVESDIEHLGENNNFERLDEDVADWLQDAGHLVLDVLGVALDPFGGAGAIPDAINGVWYLTRGCYLYAALSFLSIVPVIGDVLGKGTKLGLFLSKFKTSAALLKKVQLALSAHGALIDETFDKLERNEKTPEKIKNAVPKMRGAVDTFRTEKESPESCETGEPPKEPQEEPEDVVEIKVEPT
tara:strand:+ start:1294 stop:1935 length:642 start_codon:yes stop_codon:yes gene_type:complete